MTTTFGILTALVLAFTAFVSFKNKEEFEKQLAETKVQQTNLDRNTKTFNGLVADNKELLQEKVDAIARRDDLQGKWDTQKAENEKVEMEIATKERELETLTAQVKDEQATLQELGPLAELAPKIKRLSAQISDLEDELATLKANIDRLEGEKARTTAAREASKDKLGNINSGRSQPTMSARIDRIDRRLGFVMLSKGIKGGVVGGSKVAVMRGGEKIGELSISAVSANSATADIIYSQGG
ncbi:MAG: hypothetical protein PVJ98_11030 [Akkermansiaceae bacterium]|jgi:chromosome segregation ATPase